MKSILCCAGEPRPRQRLLVGLALVLLAACSDPLPASSGSTAPKNLILIALDTLRPDHLGCYGYGENTSPNIDAFAREAFIFQGAQSAAPWTAPSMVSLLTSLYPDVHQVTRFPRSLRLSDGIETLAERLQANGFDTAAFTEGGYLASAIGLDQGFDLYRDQPAEKPGSANSATNPARLEKGIGRFIAWLKQRDASTPFFGFFQTYEPHHPLVAPEEYIRMFAPQYNQAAEHGRLSQIIANWGMGKAFDVSEAELIQRHIPHCKLAGLGKVERLPEFVAHGIAIERPMREPDLAPGSTFSKWLNAIYDAEIRYMDDQLGHLFEHLKRSGQLDDTLILIISDHGEGLGDHDEIGHGRGLFSEILDVAFVLRVPGRQGPFVPGAGVARTIDVLPTVLELLDIAPGAGPIQGRSLVPMLTGKALPEVPSFSHALTTDAQQHSVRLGKWRLIVDERAQPVGLFDLDQDPGELTDLSVQEAAVCEQLLGLLRAQREQDAALRKQLDAAPVERDANMERLRELGYVGDE